MATTTNTKKKASMPNYLGDYMSGSYTPGYDYVSDYYKTNAGYQTPNFYGYRSNRFNIPTSSGFAIPMKENDDYWNLGAMLGGLWGANYNQRGAANARKEADAMLQDEYNKVMGAEQPQQQSQQQVTNDQLYSMAQKANSIPERQTELKMPGQEQAPKADDLGKGMGQGNIQMPDYVSAQEAARLGYKNGLKNLEIQKYYPNGVNAPANDNPEQYKRDGNNDGKKVGGDISNIDVSKLGSVGFDSDLLRANIIAKLKASGRNDWQIAQAMQGIEPQLLQKQREYNNDQFGKLYNAYQGLLKDNRYDEAGMVYAKLTQLNPEYAKVLGSQYDKRYANFAEDEKLQKRISLIKQADPTLSDREALAAALGYNKGGKGLLSNSVKTVAASGLFSGEDGTPWLKVSDKQANEYHSRRKDIHTKNKDIPFNKWSQEDRDMYTWYGNAIQANINGTGVRPFGYRSPQEAKVEEEQKQQDLAGNYDFVAGLSKKLRGQGLSWQQVAAELDKQIPDNYHYKADIIQEAMNNQAAENQKALDKEKQRDIYSGPSFFGISLKGDNILKDNKDLNGVIE